MRVINAFLSVCCYCVHVCTVNLLIQRYSCHCSTNDADIMMTRSHAKQDIFWMFFHYLLSTFLVTTEWNGIFYCNHDANYSMYV